MIGRNENIIEVSSALCCSSSQSIKPSKIDSSKASKKTKKEVDDTKSLFYGRKPKRQV